MQVFATTWNMGGCKQKSFGQVVQDMGKWVPTKGIGYDIVVVAFQECVLTAELMDAVHCHLGKYTLACRSKDPIVNV